MMLISFLLYMDLNVLFVKGLEVITLDFLRLIPDEEITVKTSIMHSVTEKHHSQWVLTFT